MDAPAIVFGILCLGLGILLHKKRAKISGGGAGGGGKKLQIPATVLTRIISGCMFFGGVGLASTFVGGWLRGMNFSIGPVSSNAVIVIAAILLGVAVLIDVVNGNGLKTYTYAMIVTFPLLWAAAGGSLALPRAISATAWSWINGAI